MKPWSRFFLAVCVCAALAGCVQDEPLDDIRRHLQELVDEGRLSGTVLIARGDEPILLESYGLADRSHGIPNRVDTKFNLGSMNKMFTAVAVLQLVEGGQLALEDRVLDHLSWYPNPEVAGQVTVEQLLTHTSGMGDFFGEAFYAASKDRIRELEDYLPLFVDQPLRFEPGTGFSYSNGGYIVLGLLIEAISGESYFDHVREHIFLPCGMTSTDSYAADEVNENLAIGYTTRLTDDGSPRSNIFVNPVKGSSAGGGYSTAEDMLRFGVCLKNHDLLGPAMTARALEGKIDFLNLGLSVMYGYGFLERTHHDQRIVGHAGGAYGVCANFDLFIDADYTAVVLTNQDTCRAAVTYLRDAVLQRIIGGPGG